MINDHAIDFDFGCDAYATKWNISNLNKCIREMEEMKKDEKNTIVIDEDSTEIDTNNNKDDYLRRSRQSFIADHSTSHKNYHHDNEGYYQHSKYPRNHHHNRIGYHFDHN